MFAGFCLVLFIVLQLCLLGPGWSCLLSYDCVCWVLFGPDYCLIYEFAGFCLFLFIVLVLFFLGSVWSCLCVVFAGSVWSCYCLIDLFAEFCSGYYLYMYVLGSICSCVLSYYCLCLVLFGHVYCLIDVFAGFCLVLFIVSIVVFAGFCFVLFIVL